VGRRRRDFDITFFAMQPASDRVVLHVEDSDDDAELVAMALNAANVPTAMVRVRDGAEALDYLFARRSYAGRDTSEQPALVLLDWHLPGLSGMDVLKTIRAHERTRELPVVVFSSTECVHDHASASRLLANCVVRKPHAYDDFAAAARAICLMWLSYNQLPVGRVARPTSPT
jgi:CheY-like chemotaxis protein